MYSLHLFGSPSIESDRGPLSGPAVQRHRLALLALLAAESPRGLQRDKLVALLWSDRDAQHARNLLNQAVHAVRKALGDEAIVSAGDELRLEPDVLPSDLTGFRRAMEAGVRERGVALYRAPFLDGFHLPNAPEFERWIEGTRNRLRRQFRRALEDLATEATARGERHHAVEWWRRLAVDDPYNSHVTLHLMEALEAAGNRAGAIEQAGVHAALFKSVLDAEPDPAIEALAERIRTAPMVDDAYAHGAQANSAAEASVADGSSPRPGVRPGSRAWRRSAVAAAVSLGALVLVVALLVSWLPAGSAPPVGSAPDAEERGAPVVAVLPFHNLSGSEADAAFSRGIHNDLITALSGIDDLTVISRASVLQYGDRPRDPKQIGRELDANVLVEGGVQRAGNLIRVNVQLADAETGRVRWANRFDGDFTVGEIFAIQTEIVRGIAVSLGASVTEEELARMATPPTGDLTAYEYLQRARHVFDGTRAGNEEAERLLRLALRLDPHIATAWAWLAQAYGWRSPYLGVATSAWDSALAYAGRALEADPNSAEAFTALALTYGHQGYLERQERMAREALRRNPNAPLAWRRLAESYRDRGDFVQALRHHKITVRLAPIHLSYRSWVAFVYTDLGEYATAERWLRDVLALDPDYLPALQGMAMLWLQRPNPDSARHYADLLAGHHPEETIALSAAAFVGHFLRDLDRAERYAAKAVEIAAGAPARSAHSTLATTLLGFARRERGDVAHANTLFDASLTFLDAWIANGTDTPRWPYEVALIHAARGDTRLALDALERAYDLGFRWLWMLEGEPVLDGLRAEPRFEELVRRVRFGG